MFSIFGSIVLYMLYVAYNLSLGVLDIYNYTSIL